MIKFEAGFMTPQGVAKYEIEAKDYISAVVNIRLTNPALKTEYPMLFIRKVI